MLMKICRGLLDSPSILFVDYADHKGNALFKIVLKSLLEISTKQIHVFCWEASTYSFIESTDVDRSHVKIYDCFSDIKGWINPKNQIDSLQESLKEILADTRRNVCIVVDSLSDMLFTIGYGQSIRDLQYVLNQSSKGSGVATQLLCRVHANVLPNGSTTLPFLKHISSTVVVVLDNEVQITHRKPGGHVEKKNEKYSISNQGEITVQGEAKSNKSYKEEKVAMLPQDVASFRVSLSEKEREDRDRLVLPYMRTPNNVGGQVFYQPDAVDDWDDEDPDDDLDI